MPATVEHTLDRHLVRFVAALREAGVAVGVGSTLDFGRAVAEVGADTHGGVYWSGRATLITRPEDISVYNDVFHLHWLGGLVSLAAAPDPTSLTLLLDDESGSSQADDETESDRDVISVRYSRAEVLGARDFATCSEAELEELYALIAHMRVGGARRPCRRRKPTNHSGRPDLRRTVREALRTGGEPMRRRFTEAGERQRRLVLLLDVSGSMEPYARALVRFVHAAMVGRRDVEAFALGTRLTRLTRELSTRDPDAALAAAALAVTDWSGGTRLGDGLKEFNDSWGVRGMARGATVVVLSDGWDRGDPEVMEEQMARLARVAHQVVWVNPLKASPGYEPLARGMSAALPHVDRFLEGHSLNSLKALAEAIDT
ncbi:MAG: VWA domain-containing protein [Acidimicrobiia bacterium]|nr:VWA domain-containing protein [Actinomycetota bacterium]MBL6927471.1 VWA domain-containing protein [Acidimicrobiia bacterium]